MAKPILYNTVRYIIKFLLIAYLPNFLSIFKKPIALLSYPIFDGLLCIKPLQEHAIITSILLVCK